MRKICVMIWYLVYINEKEYIYIYEKNMCNDMVFSIFQ